MSIYSSCLRLPYTFFYAWISLLHKSRQYKIFEFSFVTLFTHNSFLFLYSFFEGFKKNPCIKSSTILMELNFFASFYVIKKYANYLFETFTRKKSHSPTLLCKHTHTSIYLSLRHKIINLILFYSLWHFQHSRDTKPSVESEFHASLKLMLCITFSFNLCRFSKEGTIKMNPSKNFNVILIADFWVIYLDFKYHILCEIKFWKQRICVCTALMSSFLV